LGDSDAGVDGLNEFGDLLVRSFVADAYSLGEVLFPIELYSAVEGLEAPFKGSVILRTGLL
jgi:hypothetical protein